MTPTLSPVTSKMGLQQTYLAVCLKRAEQKIEKGGVPPPGQSEGYPSICERCPPNFFPAIGQWVTAQPITLRLSPSDCLGRRREST
jgi:hypothetical protein